MIVKVQTPLRTNTAVRALVYNEDRSMMTEMPITQEIRRIMQDRPKAFFHAKVKDKILVIGLEAPWQEW